MVTQQILFGASTKVAGRIAPIVVVSFRSPPKQFCTDRCAYQPTADSQYHNLNCHAHHFFGAAGVAACETRNVRVAAAFLSQESHWKHIPAREWRVHCTSRASKALFCAPFFGKIRSVAKHRQQWSRSTASEPMIMLPIYMLPPVEILKLMSIVVAYRLPPLPAV